MKKNLNIRHWIIFFSFLLISIRIPAQSLNYKEYAFPKVDYLYMDLYENANFLNTQNTYQPVANPTLFFNNLALYTWHYINKDNSQYLNSNIFRSNIQFQQDNSAIGHIVESSESIRKYGSAKKFFELGYSAALNHYLGIKSTSNHKLDTELGGTAKIGTGRIDAINEVMLSEYIVDDLKQSGVISEEVTQEQVFDLAHQLAQFRYTRILDSRNYRLQVIKSLSHWIKDNLPVRDEMDIELTSILIDNYSYAYTGFRSQGSRAAIGISPNIQNSNSFNIKKSKLTLGGNSMIEYTHRRSLSRFIQSDFYGLINIGIIRSNYYGKKITDPSINTQFNSSALTAYKFGFYPNSRTLLDLAGILTYDFNRPFSGNPSQESIESIIIPRIRFNTSYFINYKTRLFANMELSSLYNLRSSEKIEIKNAPISPFYSEPDRFPDWVVGRQFDTFLSGSAYISKPLIQNKFYFRFSAGLTFNIF